MISSTYYVIHGYLRVAIVKEKIGGGVEEYED